MNEEKFEELCEIVCENIDEPAGSGAGYGITESGLTDLRQFFKEMNMENEKIKKTPFRYIVVDNKEEKIVEQNTVLSESKDQAERAITIDIARRKPELNMDTVEVSVQPF